MAAASAVPFVPWSAFCELRCEVEQLRVALAAEREQRQRIERALLRLAPGCLDGPFSSPAAASASEWRDSSVRSCAGQGDAPGVAAPTEAGASGSGDALAPATAAAGPGGIGMGGVMHQLAQAHDAYLREISSQAAAGIAGGAHRPARQQAPAAADLSVGNRSSDAADDDDYWSHSGWGRDTLAP
jgi:hypothetical protein